MNPSPTAHAAPTAPKRWYRQLYVQVLVAIILGVVVGAVWPRVGVAMEPIGTTFVTLMKMLIGPIVFLTIVGGIAGVADLKKVGLTGLKALTYFQIGTIIALATGLVAINLLRLGNGVNADPSTLKTTGDVTPLVQAGEHTHWWDPAPDRARKRLRSVRRGRDSADHLPCRDLRHRAQRRRSGGLPGAQRCPATHRS